MDIRCPKCSEPIDMDALHDETQARFPGLAGKEYTAKYEEVRKDFYTRGCPAIESYGARCNPETVGGERGRVTAMLVELLGDDVDGLAATEEDFDLFEN